MSYNITYNIDLRQLANLIEGIEKTISEEGQRRVLEDFGRATEMVMRSECPWGERQRGVHLRDTITIEFPEKDTVDIGPVKKVGANIDLGRMVATGSRNQTIIRAKNFPYMRFYWDKTGSWHFRKQVTRGVIAPNNFVSRTADIMRRIGGAVVLNALKSELEKVKDNVS